MMRFVHITDPHLDLQPLYGVDLRGRLERLIEHIARHEKNAAFVVVTGDLVNTASPQAYRAAAEILGRLPMPVFALAGNHDDPQLMYGAFPEVERVDLAPGRAAPCAPHVVHAPLFDAVLLQTRKKGAASGLVRQEDLDRLRGVCSAFPGRSAQGDPRARLVFMHHPPFLSGIEAMDAAGLENPRSLRTALEEARAAGRTAAGIFCGHLHRTMTGLWEGVAVWCLRAAAHAVAPDAIGRQMAGLHEAPEYARIVMQPQADGSWNILSQTMRFTEDEEAFPL